MAGLSLPRQLGNIRRATPELIAGRAANAMVLLAGRDRAGARRIYGLGVDPDGTVVLDYIDGIPIGELRIAITTATRAEDITEELRG